jgi:hypothetical protein
LKAACGRPFSFRHKRKRDANGQKETRGIKEPANDDNDRKYLQAEAQSDTEPFAPGSASLPKLQKAWEELKAKIAEAKRRDDTPIEWALGNPGLPLAR